MASDALPAQIRSSSNVRTHDDHLHEARRHIDELFPDLDELLNQVAQPGGPAHLATGAAGAVEKDAQLSRTNSRTGHAYQAGRRGKRRRTLNEEVAHWEREEAAASADVEKTARSLPILLDETQTKLQNLLSSAQRLSLERYTLTDQLSGLIDGLDAPLNATGVKVEGDKGENGGQGQTLLQQMSDLQDELARLEAGLMWASVLEKVLTLSEKALAPSSHRPTPLSALPIYEDLHNLVDDLSPSLPDGMSLIGIILQIRETTWTGIKDALSKNLLEACDTIKWPTKISYTSLPPTERRTFERAFTDMLFFQAEGEALRGSDKSMDWTSGSSILPIAVLVQPVEMRFRYHFMGGKTTNRLDKPEWAFASLLDTLYQQTPFLTTTISSLTRSNDTLDMFKGVDIRSEFTLSLLSAALSLLRLRIPRILDRPSLLAHTIYQTIVFDDAIRQGGFDFARTAIGRRAGDAAGGGSASDAATVGQDWQGLTGVILRDHGWYEHWIKGEKQFVDSQMHDIIASSDAWTITEEAIDEDDGAMDGQRPTVSARQVKALIEQVTDRYMPLPELRHRLPFLLTIQLPALTAYHQRISGSLDAFENLSSAFARAIPGALSGNTRGGAHFDQTKLTGGEAGLGRLVKAQLSAAWLGLALRGWSDEPFFVELSADAQTDPGSKWLLQNDLHLAGILQAAEGASVFDAAIQQFEALCERAQDMMVRLVTVEVEGHLREHLKRRWDTAIESNAPSSPHLLSALSTYSTLFRLLSVDLPPLVLSKVYRRIVSHLSNHIAQRAVYSGWSKFTAQGGREFADEIRDFCSASQEILGTAKRPANMGIEAPWRLLSDAARILQLPEVEREGKVYEGEVTFKQAMAAAWADGPESLKVFQERSGTRLGRGDLQGILRRRVECWR